MKYNIEKQHAKQKYHAVERIRLLLDKGSFYEIGSGMNGCIYNKDENAASTPYDGVITGRGKINGKTVYVFAQDFTVAGGSVGLNHGKKIARTIELAVQAGCPVIGVYDSGGARIGEGLNSLVGCGEMLYQNTRASGVIPQISVIVGPCAGASAYSPAISDFIFAVDKIGQMYVTGNKVIESVTGEKCTLQDLGGSKVHAEKSGVVHFRYSSEKKCFQEVRRLVNILPECYSENKKKIKAEYTDKTGVDLDNLIPSDEKLPYSMHELIEGITDTDSFMEVHREFAANIIVGFGKICGVTLGIVANNPKRDSGCINCDASDKAARFVRFCDSFDIPVLTLVDTPGYLPGVNEEHSGIIRHGAKLLFSYADATTTKITVVLRKAYGGAYIAMNSRALRADYIYACPDASLAVMGADGAVSIINHREIDALSGDEKNEYKARLAEEYKQKYMNTSIAQKEGYIDEIITPGMIRNRIFEDIIALQNKRTAGYARKHSNIPL